MKVALRIFFYVLLFAILTLLTQVGGIFFLLSLLFHKIINRKLSQWYTRTILKTSVFLVLYLFGMLLVVPIVAASFGRVQLPLFRTINLQPGNALTFFLGRNYVRPALKESLFDVANKISHEFPGTVVNYLDTGFPFIDGFPLPPHLSHNDGKKADLSFLYLNLPEGTITNDIPSVIGYGICEQPVIGEEDMPALCEKKGFWQYSLLPKVVSQSNKRDFDFDEVRTKRLVQLLTDQKGIGKLFIEPHLKKRLGLSDPKIRFHGCQAVRHDDHIHVQLR